MSGSILCYLTLHVLFCLPVFDGGSFPAPFSLLLGSSHTTKACLAEWQAQGSQERCHHPLSTFISLPSFPHHRTTQWRCALHTGCEGGPAELTSRPGRDGDGRAGHYLFFPSPEMCIPAVHPGWPQLPISQSRASSQPLWGGHPWGWFLFPCPFSLPEPDMIVSLGTVWEMPARNGSLSCLSNSLSKGGYWTWKLLSHSFSFPDQEDNLPIDTSFVQRCSEFTETIWLQPNKQPDGGSQGLSTYRAARKHRWESQRASPVWRGLEMFFFIISSKLQSLAALCCSMNMIFFRGIWLKHIGILLKEALRLSGDPLSCVKPGRILRSYFYGKLLNPTLAQHCRMLFHMPWIMSLILVWLINTIPVNAAITGISSAIVGMFSNGLCLSSPQSSAARTGALIFLFSPLLWPRVQQVWWVSTPPEQCWVYAAAALTLPSFTGTQYRTQVHSSTSSWAAHSCGIPLQLIFIKALPAQGTAAVRHCNKCWHGLWDNTKINRYSPKTIPYLRMGQK